MERRYPIVDADAHVVERQERAYRPYLPEVYKKRTGSFFPSFAWDIRMNGTLGKFDESEPETYVADMDAEGIATQVLFPSSALAIGLIRETDWAAALASAYNAWLHDFCQHAPQRLKGVAVIAPQNLPRALQEMERAVAKQGMVGVMMPTYVSPGLDIGDPQFFPIYEQAERLGVPVAFHATAQVAIGNTRCHEYIGVHMTSHPFEQMLSIISVMANGVLDRFPRLRVGFLEAGVGWVPYWMDRFDEKWKKRTAESRRSELLPSEYVLANRCYFTCEPEETVLPLFVERFGDRCVMYASDYPHWDTGWPETARELLERDDLRAETKERIMSANAREFYNLG
jgi:predicted TIM-barrel fold metal-dependent hydrolase